MHKPRLLITSIRLYFLLLLVSTIPGFAQGVSIIQGQIVGLNDSKVYLYTNRLLGQPPQLVDSVRLTGQFFSFKRPINEPAGYFLSIDDTFGQFYFIWDKDLFITLNADDLNQSTIEESSVNELLKRFADTVEITYNQRLKQVRQAILQARQDGDSRETQRLYEEHLQLTYQLNEATISFIRAHKESWASLFALVSYHRDLGRKQTLDLLGVMDQTRQKSQLYTQLKEKVSDSTYLILP